MSFQPLLVWGARGELLGEMLQVVACLPKCWSSFVHGHSKGMTSPWFVSRRIPQFASCQAAWAYQKCQIMAVPRKDLGSVWGLCKDFQ